MRGLSEPVPESGTPPLRCESATNLSCKHHSFAPVEELACFRRIQIQSATCSRRSYTAWRQGLITTKPALVRLSILHSAMPASQTRVHSPSNKIVSRTLDRFEIDLSLILQVATPLSIHKFAFQNSKCQRPFARVISGRETWEPVPRATPSATSSAVRCPPPPGHAFSQLRTVGEQD